MVLKQKYFFLAAFLLTVVISGLLCAAPEGQAGGSDLPSDTTIVRAYEIYDSRFCYLTPAQFVCEKCIARGEQIVQLLSFESDGRPVRTYECRPYAKPFLY